MTYFDDTSAPHYHLEKPVSLRQSCRDVVTNGIHGLLPTCPQFPKTTRHRHTIEGHGKSRLFGRRKRPPWGCK